MAGFQTYLDDYEGDADARIVILRRCGDASSVVGSLQPSQRFNAPVYQG